MCSTTNLCGEYRKQDIKDMQVVNKSQKLFYNMQLYKTNKTIQDNFPSAKKV